MKSIPTNLKNISYSEITCFSLNLKALFYFSRRTKSVFHNACDLYGCGRHIAHQTGTTSPELSAHLTLIAKGNRLEGCQIMDSDVLPPEERHL